MSKAQKKIRHRGIQNSIWRYQINEAFSQSNKLRANISQLNQLLAGLRPFQTIDPVIPYVKQCIQEVIARKAEELYHLTEHNSN